MKASAEPDMLVEQMLQAIEADLHAAIESLGEAGGGPLPAMISHHFGWTSDADHRGGKRVRPLLCLLACQACGGVWRTALPAASSLELIHNFSLVHDDIQDRSETRRNRPTLWTLWGEPQAINAGDALFALSRRTSYRLVESGLDRSTVLEVQRELDDACLELTIGQHLDLAFEGRSSVTLQAYLRMVEAKTASLLAASAVAGARVAEASAATVEAFRSFGRNLGIAFQIYDDVLGIWGDPQVTGKPAGDDLLSHKISFPVLVGLQHSEAFLDLWTSGRTDPPALQSMMQALAEAGAADRSREAAQQHSFQAEEGLSSASLLEPAGQLVRQLIQDLLLRVR
jgi:geranylgeranyl diphosphate synthase type I